MKSIDAIVPCRTNATTSIPYDFKVKTLSELIEQDASIQSMNDTLENAILINGYDLFTYFPAKYQDTNKKALLDDLIQKRKYKPSKQDLFITRFYPKQLPINYTIEQHNDKSKTYVFIPDVFNYKLTDESDVVEWHMNFANCDIFSYYHSSLLAQDELQVLECPQLASLREYFNQQNDMKLSGKKFFNTRVIENNLPYPILISNVERVINLNTTNLYGNNFSSSSKSTVLKSYEYLNPYQTINLIAIEAPKYGSGLYTYKQIEYILQECFTAYSSAKTLANITCNLNRGYSNSILKTHIHSGWFGCGAYGGNRIIMIILQILAAKMAGIDKLIFHTVTSNCQQEIEAAETCLNNIFVNKKSSLTIDGLIEKLLTENFQWGFSNGT